jgi:hypothetical protein
MIAGTAGVAEGIRAAAREIVTEDSI